MADSARASRIVSLERYGLCPEPAPVQRLDMTNDSRQRIVAGRAVGSGKNLGRRQERMLVSFRLHLRGIMAGLAAAIQVFRFAQAFDTWTLGARLALRQILLLLVAGLGPALAQDADTLDEK